MLVYITEYLAISWWKQMSDTEISNVYFRSMEWQFHNKMKA